jgi:hypothetical protein
VVLSEGSEALAQALNFYNPVGPLSGKTGVTILAWLIAWAVLHGSWKARHLDLGKVSGWSLFAGGARDPRNVPAVLRPLRALAIALTSVQGRGSG